MVTTSNGCTDVETATAIVWDNPEAGISTTGVCDGEDSIFTATPAAQAAYHFFADANSNGVIDMGESKQDSASATYNAGSLNDGDAISVLVTTSNGCTDIETATAIVWDNPDLTPVTARFCEDFDFQTIDLSTFNEKVRSGSSDYIITWFKDPARSTPVDQLGDLSVNIHVFHANVTRRSTNCSANSTLTVRIDATVDAGTGGALDPFCEGDEINGGAVNLVALLTGADPDGAWTDMDGAGVNLTVPNSVDFTGVVNSDTAYRFKYTVTPATDSECDPVFAIVTVKVDECITECETAFGVAITGGAVDSESSCFSDGGFRRWGFTNYIAEHGEYMLELYKGAGQCDLDKGTYVGYVKVDYTSDGNVDVSYHMEGDYGMSEVHLYVGCDQYPKKKNDSYTVAPGQYTFKKSDLVHARNWYSPDITATGGFFVIAHAVVCGESIPEGSYIPPSPFEGGSFEGFVNAGCEIIEPVAEPIASSQTAEFTAYPVPFDEEISVKYNYDFDTSVKVEVFDTKGALVRSMLNTRYVKGTDGITRIDLSNTANQMFYVRLTTNKGSSTKGVNSSSPRRRKGY